MVLDFLPYKIPKGPRKKIGFIRYITFTASLLFVAALFLCHVGNLEKIMFWAFLIGNILYYAVGIILAYAFKDNRAFCKYICPITVFLKPMSYFALLRVKCDKEKCISCGKCKRVCPMEVDITDNSRKRKNGTECILCMECVKACPKRHYRVYAIEGRQGDHNESLFWIAAYGGTESVLGIIPAQVKHWHWARKDSWFSHIVVEEPGTETSNEWCEPVSEEEYQKLGI